MPGSFPDPAPLLTSTVAPTRPSLAPVGLGARLRAAWAGRTLPWDALLSGAGVALLWGCLGFWLILPTLGYVEAYPGMIAERYPLLADVLRAAQGLVGALTPWDPAKPAGASNLFWGATLLAFAAYAVGGLALARRPATRGRLLWVVGVAAVCYLVLFWGPGLFSSDLFSYVIYGHIGAIYRDNPLVTIPSHYPGDLALRYVGEWRDAPSVYGPAWLFLSTGVSFLTQNFALIDEVLVYKLVMAASYAANVALIWLIVRRWRPGQELTAALIYAWNPLVLWETAANGHNDTVMVTWLLLAVWLLTLGRRWLGLALLGVSIMTKYTTILLLPVLPVTWAWRERTWRGRALALVGSAGLVLAIGLFFYLPYWAGLDTFNPILYWSKGPRDTNYPLDFLANFLATNFLIVPGVRELREARYLAIDGLKLGGRVVLVAYLLWTFWRVRRAAAGAPAHGSLPRLVQQWATIFLLFTLLANPWFQPWYLIWPLGLVALLGWRWLTTWVVVGLSFSGFLLIHFYLWQRELFPEHSFIFLLPTLIGLAWALAQRVNWGRLRAWWRARRAPTVNAL